MGGGRMQGSLRGLHARRCKTPRWKGGNTESCGRWERMQRQSCAAACLSHLLLILGAQNDGTPDSWCVWVGLDR